MTKEESIRMLTRLKDQINFEWTDAQKKMDALNVAIEALSAERKGKWIDMNTSTTMYMPRYKCSVCGNWANHSNYCPNCGARMVRDEET